jgi:fructose-bisphosphate aldolase class II
MFDGSSLPRAENLRQSREFLERCAAVDIVLEVEIGLVGGEEDGVVAHDAAEAALYSTPEDALAVVEELGRSDGRYLLAATFGNVHGVYADVNAKLRPEILGELQEAVIARHGDEAAFNFVFHGGSGSSPAQIAEALSHGVVKMNVDTDMQYAYSRAVADHLFRNYDAVLKVDGRFGDKKAYDPRAWTRAAEASMAARVVQACEDLGATGKSLHRQAAAPTLR